MRLHFERPPQVRAGISMTYTALLSSVYYAVKAVLDPTMPPNSGLARPLTVTSPAGTIFNAVHPVAVNGRTSTAPRPIASCGSTGGGGSPRPGGGRRRRRWVRRLQIQR
jgi:N-methylhydantoinase B